MFSYIRLRPEDSTIAECGLRIEMNRGEGEEKRRHGETLCVLKKGDRKAEISRGGK